MKDNRPQNCRFRLQDEGKAYPRSSCQACGKTITTGLGKHCTAISAPKKIDEGHNAKEAERYYRAAHRVQSAIAFNPDKTDSTPKNLRVGIDLRASDMAGLVRLLIAKGVFTEAEYLTAIADAAENEATSREDDLSAKYGINIRTV